MTNTQNKLPFNARLKVYRSLATGNAIFTQVARAWRNFKNSKHKNVWTGKIIGLHTWILRTLLHPLNSKVSKYLLNSQVFLFSFVKLLKTIFFYSMN